MASDNEVEIPIKFETEGAQKQLNNFQKNSTASFSNIALAVTGINQALELAGKAFDFVLAPLARAISEASEAEKQFTILSFSIAATGEYSDDAAASMSDFADEIQKTTTYSDDAAIASLTLAKNFGLTNEEAQDLVKTATGLAAVTGQTLPNATSDLLSTLNGQSRALKELGTDYTNLTEDQLRAGEAIKLVKENLGGTAEALTGTFSGALAQASNNFGDLFKEFGFGITQSDYLIKSINLTSEAFSSIGSVIKNYVAPAIKSFIDFFIVAIANAADYYNRFVNQAIQGFTKLGTGIFGTLAKFTGIGGDVAQTFKDIGEASDDSTKNISASVDAFFEAESSASKTKSALDKVSQSAKGVAAGFGKSREEALKFAAELTKSNEDQFQQAVRLYDEQVVKIKKFVKEKSLTQKEGDALIEESYNKALDSILDAQDKADAQLLEQQKKSIAERRKLVEDAAKDPANAIVQKLKIEPADISDNEAEIAGFTAGVISKILDGAAGAKSLIASGAGAFADAFIPGIGGAVTSIVSKLAEGPDATKAFIKEFIAAVPDIVNAIAESIPVVVETFVDVMVNKGGAARIGVAIAKAMSGQTIFKKAGLNIAEGFNAKLNGGKFYDGLKAAIAGIGPALSAGVSLAAQKFSSSLGSSIGNFSAGIVNAFSAGAARIVSAISGAFTPITSGITNAFSPIISFFSGFGSSLSGILEKISSAFQTPEWLERLYNIVGTEPRWLEKLKNIFSTPSWIQRLYDIIATTPKWVDSLKDFLNKFKISVPGFGGASGNVLSDGLAVATGGLSRVAGLASGGEVPKGYPNDTFPARLTSGEMIVPTDTTSQLKQFLTNGSSAKSGSDNEAIQIALLTKIATLLQQPMTVETTAQVNGKAFADIILGLNRSNARLTA